MILPMVVEKLIRSCQDVFIDNSIYLLPRSKQDYSPLLKEKYAEIRSPYVQSVICLILGYRGGEDVIPWVLEKYFEMKRLYPDKTYDQGPRLALHELNSRFHKK